jgi:hypothetical protein
LATRLGRTAVNRLKKEQQDFEAVRKLWRRKGPLGKFHNTVLFIRKTPQRRDAWDMIIKGLVEKDLDGNF